MKKLFLLVTMMMASVVFGQRNDSKDFGIGFSENWGPSINFSFKKPDSFGWYFAVRGLNLEFDYSYGIDYSDITSSSISEPIITDSKDFGVSLGTIYNIRNSNFSIGGGLGYGIDYKKKEYKTIYDFKYIKDEYKYDSFVIAKHKVTAEAFLDISFKKTFKKTFGVQLGYSTFHKAFGVLYYSF